MAKAKRERRSSIRTMSADTSALDALESLERAERAAREGAAEAPDEEPTPVAPEAVDED
jgi:hypothetical protein